MPDYYIRVEIKEPPPGEPKWQHYFEQLVQDCFAGPNPAMLTLTQFVISTTQEKAEVQADADGMAAELDRVQGGKCTAIVYDVR